MSRAAFSSLAFAQTRLPLREILPFSGINRGEPVLQDNNHRLAEQPCVIRTKKRRSRGRKGGARFLQGVVGLGRYVDYHNKGRLNVISY